MTIETALRVLELPEGASWDVVRNAYRDLLMVWHPDRFSADSHLHSRATSKTQEIIKAYVFLKQHYKSSAGETSSNIKRDCNSNETAFRRQDEFRAASSKSACSNQSKKSKGFLWRTAGHARGVISNSISLVSFVFLYLPGVAFVAFAGSFAGRIMASLVFTLVIWSAVIQGETGNILSLARPHFTSLYGNSSESRLSAMDVLRIGGERCANLMGNAVNSAIENIQLFPRTEFEAVQYRYITPAYPKRSALILSDDKLLRST